MCMENWGERMEIESLTQQRFKLNRAQQKKNNQERENATMDTHIRMNCRRVKILIRKKKKYIQI